MNFLFPQGIGDAAWALLKIQDIAKKHKATSINIKVACFTKSEIEMRGFPFLERFSFVDSVSWFPMNRKDRPGPVIRKGFYIDALGRYVYIKSGPTKEFPGIDFVTIPNHDLERGIRLENWLPEYKINWNAIKDNFIFKNHEEDFAKIKIEANKKYCAFFMGNMASNSEYGHNRDSLWTIQDWIDLGNGLLNKNMVDEIIVVGATYDKDYYSLIGPQVNSHWHDFVGKLTVPECFAITKYVNFIISYQSGIGIVSSYFGTPTGIFWREKGNSVHPNKYVSFEESMAEGWVSPEMLENKKHMGLIYERHDVNYILKEIEQRKW